jgi:hypothetical protein
VLDVDYSVALAAVAQLDANLKELVVASHP